MKRTVIALLMLVAVGSLTSLRYSSNAFGDPSPGTSTKAETITGRVTSLDTKAVKFAVRSSDGKVVHLKAADQATLGQLRRGERVIVTYADGVALTIQATRSEKSP